MGHTGVLVSTKDRGQDVANQLGELRRYCAAAQNWVVVVEYQDYDSGSYANRARFQAMLADAAALELAEHHGVAFRSITEPYLDSIGIFKDMVIAVLGTICETGKGADVGTRTCGAQSSEVASTKSGRPIGPSGDI